MARIADTTTFERLPAAGVVAVPAVLAAVLACLGLTARSLGFDEGATVVIVSQHGAALRAAIARDGGNMSGYYLLLHVLIGWFGSGPVVLRLPSVVSTVATTALVAVLGLQLFDRRVALVAGVLTAVSLPLVFWAQTARGYAAMTAFTCAGFVCFVALARAGPGGPGGPGGRGGSGGPGGPAGDRGRLAAIGYVVAMVLACYASFVAVLVVPVQLLALARRPAPLRRLLVALVALAVCCIPIAVLAVRRGSGQLFWVPKPSHKVDTQVLQSLTATGLAPSFHPSFTTTAALIATVVALLGLVVAAVRARRARRGDGGVPASWPMALVLAWVAVPVALTFVYSLVSQPIFEPRNLLTVVPAIALALAVGVTHPRLPRALALAALVLAVAVRVVPLAASYGVSPEPWRQATADVLAHSRPGDCVAFYPEDARNPFWYYVRRADAGRRAPRSILPAVPWGRVESFVERYEVLSPARLATAAAGCERMWLVSSHEGQTDGSATSLAHRAGYRQFDAELERAFGTAPIQTFGYASQIHVQLLAGSGRRRPG